MPATRLLSLLLSITTWVFATSSLAQSNLDKSQVSITILHTTDLHANILPTTDYKGTPDVGGAARCAAKIREIRRTTPHVLLVDAGDLYQGSAVGWRTRGSVMTRTINYLDYTSWTLGNHEFDWGAEILADRILESQVPVLAANLNWNPLPDGPEKLKRAASKVRPYTIEEIAGIKIGIIGLTTPGIPNWSRPRLIPGIGLEDSVKSLQKVIPELKAAGCEILVLVAHQAIKEDGDDHANQLFSVIRAFPEIDLVIGGHSHRVQKFQWVNKTLYSQAGYWGSHLGKVELIYDKASRKLIKRWADMIPMDSSVPFDEGLMALLDQDLKETEQELDTRIGAAKDRIHTLTGPRRETPAFNLICEAINAKLKARGVNAELIIHGILNERAVINPGPVKIRDVYEVIPYENTIGVAQLKGSQIWEILEENATAYPGGRFRGTWGMRMHLDPTGTKKGAILKELKEADGTPVDLQKTYTVAFNSYELASGGTRWRKVRSLADMKESQLAEYDFQTREAVIEYIKANSPLVALTNGWWTVEKAPRKPKPTPKQQQGNSEP
jgi:2',3'-cyclic-nucleotide 2'-phosphodiesterase (5'-nucleotidase family)